MNREKAGKWMLVIMLAIVLTACKGNAESQDEKGNRVEGTITIDGSGTVYPLMAKLAETYMTEEQSDVSVEVSRAGTGAGFEKFLTEDGTDFNDASRPIKPEETEKADALGMDVMELKVALDGLTFVIHPENDWAKEMTKEEIISIFLADDETKKWSDINPDWPNEKINTYGPNENHGTYEFFYEDILEKQEIVSDITLQQDYSTLVNLMENDPNGIAFFGFGFYVNNQEALQAVQVDFGDGAVEPSLDTIAEDGDYAPFTRPVFTYLNANHAQEKAQVYDFTVYILEHINEFAGETGFAPIPEEEIQANLDELEAWQ